MIEEPPILTIRANWPRPTQSQIDVFKDVPTGFVCDAMGGTGALDTDIAPISGHTDITCRAVGPAIVADNGPAEILATIAALHHMQRGDIVVAAVHGYQSCSACGDQFLGMLKNNGAAGFVTDGPMRDYEGLRAVGLPAWCTGMNPNSPYSNGPGHVGGSAIVGGRTVASGDLIVADCNGVVVVPFAQIEPVIAKLADVRRLEDALESKVKNGLAGLDLVDEMLADGRAVMQEN